MQTVFQHSQTRRPADDILTELSGLRHKPLIFFVDDNITSNMEQAKELFRALIPLKIKWVSQASINAAHDEEFLELMSSTASRAMGGAASSHPAGRGRRCAGLSMASQRRISQSRWTASGWWAAWRPGTSRR